ncbi:hypothetical protein KCU99_g4721, partial [Aureobasidium melanogenum]
MSHFSVDRSRSNQKYLRNRHRLTRFKTEVDNNSSDVEQLEVEFRHLPACLREQDLVLAINGAMAGSFALGERAGFWQIEKGEQGVAEMFEEVETYLENDFIPLMRGKDDPESLQDYLHTDRPMLGLRVISFKDATLVTLSCSHLLFDGLGRKAVMAAWSSVLHGREEKIMDLQGVFEDPLARLGTQAEVRYKHELRVMGLRQLVMFGIRALLRRTFFKSDVKDYVVCVPDFHMGKLRRSAIEDIANTSNAPAVAPFLSDSDILCAWWSRYLASCTSKKATDTFVINTLLGLRKILTPELLRPENPYVSNAIMMMPTFVTAAELRTKSLGEVALSLRQTIEQLSTRAQVEARFSLDRAWQQRTGHPALYGDPWMRMVICTNWIKSKIYDVDFSPALLDKKSSDSDAVCPTYTQLHAIVQDFDLINGFAISKDADNNYWIYSQLDTKHRSKVEQMLFEEA